MNNPIVLLYVLVIAFLGVLLLVLTLTLAKLYKKVPPGAAGVIMGQGGMQAFTGGGAFVFPILHEFHWVHAEAETIEFAEEKLVVQLILERDSICTAAMAFGSKDGVQLREILQTLADSAHDDRELLIQKLAEVGYRVL